MTVQTVFRRYELKYLLTEAQKRAVLRAMEPHMALDPYGRSTIRNIYFDTDDYRLIRRSLEKPAYKEKLRLRSYSQVGPEDSVFVELKKKYRGVVYKRRITLPEREAMAWLAGEARCRECSQIAAEVDYFLEYYRPLGPKVFLSYEREAYYAGDEPDFRVTFDEHILCRREDLSLESEACGRPILPEGTTLMELKCAGGIPLWMAHALSGAGIYQTSFSKYGAAYRSMIYPTLRKEGARRVPNAVSGCV